ncbi:MAG: hypothetical protein NTX76_00975 [Alphaproteobacteria bacterium]|nr:hypothetical protein [Alphaproteobacteria bacterium]
MNLKSKLFACIIGVGIVGTGTVQYVEHKNIELNEKYMSQFTRDDALGAYKESAPQFYLPLSLMSSPPHKIAR